MEGVVRVDDTPQHKAVREALINAIIHADYMVNGILQVVKTDTAIEISNPGLLKLPLAQIYHGGESKARNQRIQTLLRMVGYGENIGSGFPMILHAWKEKDWDQPTLTEQPELLQVKLVMKLKMENELGVGVLTELATRKDEDFLKDCKKEFCVEITVRQMDIVVLIGGSPEMSAQKIAQKIHVSDRTVRTDVKWLKEKGFIDRKDGRKGGRWVLLPNGQKLVEMVKEFKSRR